MSFPSYDPGIFAVYLNLKKLLVELLMINDLSYTASYNVNLDTIHFDVL